MPSLRRRSLLAFGLAFILVAVCLELIRWSSLPARRPLGKPAYAAGPAAWREDLIGNRPRAVRGPAFGGLVPGQRVFASPQEAAEWIRHKGWDEKRWAVYLVDVDWPKDTSPAGQIRRLNKNSLILMEVVARPKTP